MELQPSNLFVFLETSTYAFDIPDLIFTSFAECEEFAKSQSVSGQVMSLSEALDNVYENIRWDS